MFSDVGGHAEGVAAAYDQEARRPDVACNAFGLPQALNAKALRMAELTAEWERRLATVKSVAEASDRDSPTTTNFEEGSLS